MNRMKAAKGAEVVKCPGDDNLSLTNDSQLNTEANDKEYKYDNDLSITDGPQLNTEANDDASTSGASGILFTVFLLPVLFVVHHKVC